MVSKKGIHTLLKDSFRTNSENETLQLAEKLGKGLRPGSVVALRGEIGSGKTLFIKGLCQGLGVKDADRVKSPTFVLLHVYRGKFPIHHFDLYRLEQERELDTLGFEEFLANRQAVSLIEWADRAENRIPSDALWVDFKVIGPSSRGIKIIGRRPNENYLSD